jgi:hypothetical protein
MTDEAIRASSDKLQEWRAEILEHKYQIVLALAFLAIASTLNYYFGTYVSSQAIVATVPDLILDNLPCVSIPLVSTLYVWLYISVFVVLFAYPFFFRPRRLHYVLGMTSLFILVRAVFVTFTHLKTPDDAVHVVFPWVFQSLHFTNDMFFSGHAGLPFLGFLMFRRNKIIRTYMLVSSILLGAVVLLLHQHYSIDVFSAFFITYGIYRIGGKVFNNVEGHGAAVHR